MQDEFLKSKFLDTVKRIALDNKDTTVPYDRPDLFQAKLWTIGVIQALTSSGYEISKKEKK